MKDEIKEILDEMKFIQEKKVKFYSLDIYQSKLLLDYITILEEENEKLKKRDKTRNVFNEHITNIYKARNNKAIEYINNHKKQLHHSFDEPDFDYLLCANADELLNILQVDDNNAKD